MNSIKKLLGIVWILLALLAAFYSVEMFGPKLTSGKQDDLVFGIIMFFILLPLIVTGLVTFGYFAFSGDYNEMDE
jgi:amino acid transporter